MNPDAAPADLAAATAAPAIPLAEFERLALEGVPLVAALGCRVVRLARGLCAVRLPFAPLLLRPGGTIGGPAMMALADIALYGAVLSMIGRVELAVTTDLHIRFLRKPPPGDLLAEARIVRLGRRLAVGEVLISGAAPAGPGGAADPVAHATGAYAIPDGGPAGGGAAGTVGRPGAG